MPWCNEFVTAGTALRLGALIGQQMPETRCTPHEFARSGELESLRDGLFRLLHRENKSIDWMKRELFR